MQYTQVQLGVITHIGEEWSTANIMAEPKSDSDPEEPVDRTGIPTRMLPRGTKVGDRVTLYVVVTNALTKVEKRP